MNMRFERQGGGGVVLVVAGPRADLRAVADALAALADGHGPEVVVRREVAIRIKGLGRVEGVGFARDDKDEPSAGCPCAHCVARRAAAS